MANNLPDYFVDDIRLQIVDQTSYSDNEIYSYIRLTINRTAPLIQADATVTGGSGTYDYTAPSGMDYEYWEVIKWGTVVNMLTRYKHKIIGDGIGVAITLGSEKIDTKSVLLTVKDLIKDAKRTLNEKILAYNLTHRQGTVIDLYYSEKTWS